MPCRAVEKLPRPQHFLRPNLANSRIRSRDIHNPRLQHVPIPRKSLGVKVTQAGDQRTTMAEFLYSTIAAKPLDATGTPHIEVHIETPAPVIETMLSHESQTVGDA